MISNESMEVFRSEAESAAVRTLSKNFQDNQICFVVPAGAKIDAISLDLPGGMLILGALRGKVTCATGSILIAKGGVFQGSAEAVDIYIEGRVSSPADGPRTKLKARGVVKETGEGVKSISGGVIAFSVHANVHAQMLARSYHVPRGVNLNASVMETI